MELVLSFSRERHALTARELAAATGIPLPSVYRYLAMLRDMALVSGNERGVYRLTARWIAVARAAEAAEPLIEVADSTMRELANRTGETVLLVRLVSGAAVCVHRIESRHQLRISFEVGQSLPLERGASARLLLSTLPAEALERRLDALSQVDPVLARRLREQVDAIRVHGWATSQEELESGIWAVAAAVRDGQDTVAALTVPTPVVRASEAVREKLLGQVLSAAADISRQLDGATLT